MRFRIIILMLVVVSPAFAQEPPLREEADKALRRSAEFFLQKVASHGGYLWRYSADLQRREGEGRADASIVWVQPPGTPSIGEAFLQAYRDTGKTFYLEAARRAAECLIRGQLRSGGWGYHIEFSPQRRGRYAYRVEPAGKSQRNVTTLDDNTTQAAMRFLMQLDRALEFRDAELHEAVAYGLRSLLKAQYANGAWPQRYEEFPDPKKHRTQRASFPKTWPRQWPGSKYASYYTLNDNTMSDMIDVMLLAEDIYETKIDCLEATINAAYFLSAAQLPKPQPGWAQQYDENMQPAWARKFEPPAITGGEARGAIEAMIKVSRFTGDICLLMRVEQALDYYEKSRLPSGQLARFYELKTNRPLYFTRKYKLTYKDDDLPTHYSFKTSNWVPRVRRQYEKAMKDRAIGELPQPSRRQVSEAEVKRVIAALDQRGAWVEDGRLRKHGEDDPTRRIISCQTFLKNFEVLSAYCAKHQK